MKTKVIYQKDRIKLSPYSWRRLKKMANAYGVKVTWTDFLLRKKLRNKLVKALEVNR